MHLSEEVNGNESLPNAIADHLRNQIVRGTLLPGSHLGQTQLAEQYGRSKVPVREALKRLATEGFLRHDRNRGYFVAPLDEGEARQLYKLRRWIERDLLESAAWPDADQVAAFRAMFDRVDAMDKRRDFEAWAAELARLRHAIFDLSPQKTLLQEATRLWTLTDRYRALLPRDDGGSPERALIDALEARDRERLVADYLAGRARVEEALDQAFSASRFG